MRIDSSFYEEIKSRLNSGNACSYSIQNPLSSSLLVKKQRLQNTLLHLVLCEYEMWTPMRMEACSL